MTIEPRPLTPERRDPHAPIRIAKCVQCGADFAEYAGYVVGATICANCWCTSSPEWQRTSIILGEMWHWRRIR